MGGSCRLEFMAEGLAGKFAAVIPDGWTMKEA
jgi:hypothetical protein